MVRGGHSTDCVCVCVSLRIVVDLERVKRTMVSFMGRGEQSRIPATWVVVLALVLSFALLWWRTLQ